MRLNFNTDDGYASDKALGIVVLKTDETLEPEIAPIIQAAGRSLYHTRIDFQPQVTPQTLASMEYDLPRAVGLFSDKVKFKVIGYACTSGATIMGSKKIRNLIRIHHPMALVCDPIEAVIIAARVLNARRIGFLTPYRADVSLAMREKLHNAGLRIVNFASFEQQNDHKVALICEGSVLAGMKYVGKMGCDMVFSACTNLCSFNVIAAAEDALNIPVVSSNSVLAWRMLRLSGVKGVIRASGQLFKY